MLKALTFEFRIQSLSTTLKVYEARRPLLEKAVKAILADEKEAKKFEAFKSERMLTG